MSNSEPEILLLPPRAFAAAWILATLSAQMARAIFSTSSALNVGVFSLLGIFNIPHSWYRPLLITMVFTGIRSSEARGLRWEDVDLKGKLLHIRQRADRYGKVGMPKSEAGQRTVPLPPMVVNTLKEWQLACPSSELGLVFPNQAGNIEFHQNMLHRGLWATQLAAEMSVATGKTDDEGKPILEPKYTGFHALRHWYASWCINRKADGGLELTAKAVQTRMGHSSIQVTFDTYGHLFPSVDEGEEMAAAEKALFAVNAT